MATVVSSPGKVLLAGGYLILDRPHAGAVLALDARFYSGLEFVVLADAPAAAASESGIVIEVHSPQFRDERRYVYTWGASAAEASLDPLPPCGGGKLPKPNRYVELPLLYGLTLARHRHGGSGGGFFSDAVERAALAGMVSADDGTAIGLRLTLCADNGFYSQTAELAARGLPPSAESLRALPRMLPPRTDGGEIAKTGLGSSATLVTSLSAALLHAFGVIALPARAVDGGAVPPSSTSAAAGDAALSLLHNFAQLCHCAAQGKVGSGFDVCVAVYGSQRYTRFSPALLAPLLALPAGTPPPAAELATCVGGTAGAADGRCGATWDHVVEPFQLPPGIEVLMGDVSGGANTPSMVKQVIAWRKADPAAPALWREYAEVSKALQGGLLLLCELHRKLRAAKMRAGGSADAADGEWVRTLARCGRADPSAWPAIGSVGEALSRVRGTCLKLRQLLREISRGADTPIEPPEQTALLDATMAVAGVVMAVVPGAGGNDALLALVLPSVAPPTSGDAAAPVTTTEGTRAAVAKLWRSWPDVAPPPKPAVVCALPVIESKSSADGRNGVLLEGGAAAELLRSAREAPPSPGTPIGRKLLRVLTQSEVEAQVRAKVHQEMLVIACAGAALALAALAVRRVVGR